MVDELVGRGRRVVAVSRRPPAEDRSLVRQLQGDVEDLAAVFRRTEAGAVVIAVTPFPRRLRISPVSTVTSTCGLSSNSETFCLSGRGL